MSLLPFAQLDLPGRLALADGRYLIRSAGSEAETSGAQPDVLVIRTLGAQRARSRLRRGKPVPLETGPETALLSLVRVTLIRARPLEDRPAADSWLERIGSDAELADGLVAETCRTINRALHAYRVAAPDPYAADVHPDFAVAVRFGYGSGEEVADGRWTAAHELPPPKRGSRRSRAIDSVGASEHVAAVLGGRDEVSPAESLASLAELAFAEGRTAEAALLAATAHDAAARAGLEPDPDLASPLAALRERALAGDKPDRETVRKCLGPLRRSLRAT